VLSPTQGLYKVELTFTCARSLVELSSNKLTASMCGCCSTVISDVGLGLENCGKVRSVGACKPTVALETDTDCSRGRCGSTTLQLDSLVTLRVPNAVPSLV